MFETQNFRDKMATLERRHEEVGALLGTAEVINKRAEFLKLSREHAELDPLVAAWKSYEKLLNNLAAAKLMVDAETDPELRELARDEAKELEEARGPAEQAIKILLLPKDPNDGKNAILEIRGGTGGDEAALFAGDLYRMYTRFAERQGWKLDVMSLSRGHVRRLQRSHHPGRRQGRVLEAQVRVRRASRPARARDRGAGPHPHLDRDGRRAARSRRSRRQDR